MGHGGNTVARPCRAARTTAVADDRLGRLALRGNSWVWPIHANDIKTREGFQVEATINSR